MPSNRASRRAATLVVENSSVPFDRRVWREALALRDAGWAVAVVCPRMRIAGGALQAAREQLDGVAVRRFALTEATGGVGGFLREYGSAYMQIAGALNELDDELGLSVLHFANPPDIFFPLAWRWRARGCRIVFDHHDLFPESCAQRFPGTAGRVVVAVARFCERRSMRAADVVIATNESYADIARSRGGVAADRVFVVRNGPELNRFRPVDPDPSLRRGRRHLVAYLGIMGPQDGMRQLMEAIRHFVHALQRRDTSFVVMGDGSEQAWMEQARAEWGLSEFVEMTGLVTDDTRIVRTLSTADVCVAPEPRTPFTDRSTIVKVAEYMACGRPVVAFELRETRTTADEAALYVASGRPEDFAAAVSRLLDSPELRDSMGQIGRARVMRSLAWERQVPSLLAAYDRATGM